MPHQYMIQTHEMVFMNAKNGHTISMVLSVYGSKW
jgi:hypothetical protein